MNRLFAILLLGLASCQQHAKVEEKPVLKTDVVDSMNNVLIPNAEKKYSLDEIYRKYINTELLSYIERVHPTWSVPTENLWYPQLFNKYKTKTSLVNYIIGDFDCNGLKDHALILDKGKNGLAAVAFLRLDSGFKTVELSEIMHKEGEKIDYVLTLYKPGHYDIDDPDLGPSDPHYVYLKCNSVGIGMFKELYEGGDDVYYWERNELRSCVIEK